MRILILLYFVIVLGHVKKGFHNLSESELNLKSPVDYVEGSII